MEIKTSNFTLKFVPQSLAHRVSIQLSRLGTHNKQTQGVTHVGQREVKWMIGVRIPIRLNKPNNSFCDSLYI